MLFGRLSIRVLRWGQHRLKTLPCTSDRAQNCCPAALCDTSSQVVRARTQVRGDDEKERGGFGGHIRIAVKYSHLPPPVPPRESRNNGLKMQQNSLRFRVVLSDPLPSKNTSVVQENRNQDQTQNSTLCLWGFLSTFTLHAFLTIHIY